MSAERNDGGSAFPSHSGNPEMTDPRNRISCGGMTPRDWFAGQALIGMGTWTPSAKVNNLPAKAEWAYAMADAMLKARSAP